MSITDKQKFIFKHGWNQKNGKDRTDCGSGSLLVSCQEYIDVINKVIKNEIRTINDIGCGDLNYIKHTNIHNTDIDYLGYDYKLRENVETDKYKVYNKSFNIINEIPRNCDLTICKEVLNHLDQKTQVIPALNNIKKTTKYLIITNHMEINENNLEENLDARFEKINFNIEPYNLKKYLQYSTKVTHIRRHTDRKLASGIYVSVYKFN